MPKVKVNDITINYEQQGSGEPLVLIPYLAADNACYAFQVADYAKHFTCISLDPRGAGETDKPDGTYSTELFADDVAGFMQAIGVERAHVSGVSLGAAIGLWLASKYPQRVKTLSLHSALAEDRPFPQGDRRRLADHRQGSRQRPGDGRPGDPPFRLTPDSTPPNPNTSTSSPPSSAAGRSSRSTPSFASRTRLSPTMRSASSARSRRRRRSPSAATTS